MGDGARRAPRPARDGCRVLGRGGGRAGGRGLLAVDGIEAEVIDLRTLDAAGTDYATIGASLARTGCLAIVEHAPSCASLGPRIAAECQRRFFDALDGPVALVAGPDVPLARLEAPRGSLHPDGRGYRRCGRPGRTAEGVGNPHEERGLPGGGAARLRHLMAGAQAKPALKLLGISRWNPNPAWAPTDTSVQKAIAAAANAYVGRTVTMEWGTYPPDTTYRQFLQMREAAGNLPVILLLDDLHDDAEAYEYAIRKGLIRSYTLAELSKYMPGYVARFKQYGTDASFAFSENAKTTGQRHGQALVHPVPVQRRQLPGARVPNNFSKPSPDAGLMGGMFRDDLLKKVYPAARPRPSSAASCWTRTARWLLATCSTCRCRAGPTSRTST